MKRLMLGPILGVLCVSAALAQGRGGNNDWKTAGSDAQRTSWKKTDRKLTPETIASKFQLVWQFKVPNQARQLNSLRSQSPWMACTVTRECAPRLSWAFRRARAYSTSMPTWAVSNGSIRSRSAGGRLASLPWRRNLQLSPDR